MYRNYNNLLIEIEEYKERLEDLRREEYGLNRIRDTHKIGVELYANKQTKLHNEKAIILSILEDKEQTLKETIERLKKLEGLEYKIEYKKNIEGKSLKEIAEELNYNYCYVRRVYSKTKTSNKGVAQKVI